MTTTRAIHVGLCFFACVLGACADDDEGGTPPGSDAGPVDGGDGGGAVSGARAWVLDDADLPEDPSGYLATYRAGDFGLANEKIAVLIEDVGVSDLYDPWGGKPVGMALVNAQGRLVQAADFNELLVALGRYVLATDSVEIEADGSDGKAARIRARGKFSALPFIDDFAMSLFPNDYSGDGSLVWELEPGAEHVNLYFSVDRTGQDALLVDDPMNLVFQRERMQEFSAEQGFAVGNGALPYLAFTEDATAGFAFLSPNGNLTQPVDPQAGFNLIGGPALTFPADAEVDVLAYRIVIGGPGLDGLQQALARANDTALETVAGRVLEADGSGAAGVHVHALGVDDAYLNRALTDASGAFRLQLPAGSTVTLSAYRTGSLMVSADAAAGDTDVSIQLAASATLALRVGDAADAPSPFRVQVLPMDDSAEPPANFGEVRPGAGRMYLEAVVDGTIDLPVPAGTYRVIVSRGYEYSLHDEEVMAVAGETVDIQATLEHVVDTTGVMCADAHIHTHRSPDASDDGLTKLKSAIAEGLDVAIRSEHEWVMDFSREVEMLGAAAMIQAGIGGEELTTFEWGHMGVFPLTASDQANGGAVDWIDMTPPEVFAVVRARPEDPVLVINHPRLAGGLLGDRQAYFDVAGFDATTGAVEHPELWDEGFRVIELFNSEDFETQREGTVPDLFQLLNQGRKVFAAGASDSHTVATTPLGYPRTCLLVDEDDPAALTAAMVRTAYDDGHSTVSGGIFLSVAVDGTNEGPGDTATGKGAMALLNVKVQAPSWVDVTSLEVIVDGTTTETLPIAASSTVTRFEEQVMVPVAAAGSWVVLHAKGEASLAPVHSDKQPFAFSNPIFIER